MTKRRVVVTGLGIVSPVGNTITQAWDNLLAGKSGIGPITHFDPQNIPVKIAGEVKDFNPEPYVSKKDLKKMDTFIQYGVVAAGQAVEDAGLDNNSQIDLDRVGVFIGSGIGGLPIIETMHTAFNENGARKVSPFFIPSAIINMVSGNISIKYGFKGPNIGMVTACTTGTHNIGMAYRSIVYGDADIMLAGGTEMATTGLCISGFAAARALSTRNEEPEKASRPWDKGRDGFVLSEGAGVLVLEEYEHAKKRGAKIYAELIGYGMNADAYHMTLPSENGVGASKCMNIALKDAQIAPEQVDYINAHGTSTPAGDLVETQAIKTCFKDHANKIAVNSTKSMTGHLLGAAGAVEAVFSVLTIQNQISPPTINIEDPDPECDLDYVADNAREMKINIALSNSFGFGGTNGSIIFKKI